MKFALINGGEVVGCIGGGSDRLRDVEYLECDRCSAEVEKLYVLDGKELCEECLFDEIETIEL